MEKLFLIDGQNLAYRAFYGLPALTNSKGKPTGAILGFTNMLLKILKEENPDYIAVAFDLPRPTFRHKIYGNYKATRQKSPETLREQLPLIKEIISYLNIPIIEIEGYEADDCLGTIAKSVKNEVEVVLVSGDKDMLQLVDSRIKVMNRKPQETIVYDEEQVKERFAVVPQGIVDILALSGDSSDNIPGIPGIGLKTAIKLIDQFGSLEKIKDNLGLLPENLADKLKEHFEDALLSRRLVTIDTKVPLRINLEEFKVKGFNQEKLLSIFKELEFSRLIKEMGGEVKEGSMQIVSEDLEKREIKQEKDLSRLISRIKENKIVGLEIIFSEEEIEEILVESEGVVYNFCQDFLRAQIKEKQSLLRAFLEDGEAKKIGRNLKEKIVFLNKKGIALKGCEFDLSIAHYLLNPERNIVEEKIGNFFSLREGLEAELKEKDLRALLDEVEMPLVSVLATMEIAGIKLDVYYLKELSKNMQGKLEEIAQEIYRLSGEEFNINSPKALGKILFGKLKLPTIKRTKTGYSTDVEVLTRLAVKHELPAKVLVYRELSKLTSTYVDVFPKLIAKDGRIHTCFNQAGTATGRLSSRDPNLQNIPVKTELGREIRRAFVAEKGYCFLSADYSQIELRVMAHLSGDEALVRTFENDEDVHLITASELLGKPSREIDKEGRRMAKMINYAILYGMGSHSLSRELGIGREEAQDYIDRYFLRYPGVKRYIEDTLEKARQNGYVKTILKRIRFLPDINSENNNLRAFNERLAINSPLQGSASDLIKLAMVDIFREFNQRKMKSRLLLQIHDELLFEIPEEEKEMAFPLIKEKMEKAYCLNVPLKVDLNCGNNWADLKK